VVFRSYDGSILRVEAPPGTFKSQSDTEAGKSPSSSMLPARVLSAASKTVPLSHTHTYTHARIFSAALCNSKC